VATLSGGAFAVGGSASAQTGDGAPVRTIQVQDSTQVPETGPDTAPDNGRDRDCPEKDRQGGTAGTGGDAPDGTLEAPDSAPVTTEL
jgi:hypothetical protein